MALHRGLARVDQMVCRRDKRWMLIQVDVSVDKNSAGGANGFPAAMYYPGRVAKGRKWRDDVDVWSLLGGWLACFENNEKPIFERTG
jgi:hypothetical protein